MTTTMKTMSPSGSDASLWQVALDVVISTRLEIMMFALAVVGYLLLFSKRVPNDVQRMKQKLKLAEGDEDDQRPREVSQRVRNPKNVEAPDASAHRALLAAKRNEAAALKIDVAKYIVMIRKCASEKNLSGAMSTFESLKATGVELNTIMYNTVLDACVKCQDLKAAEAWMRETVEAGMADVVSYNTLMKAHLHNGDVNKARGVMADMKAAGSTPNRVTFNELLNAAVTSGKRSDIWQIVKDMKEASMAPNQVSCSILLKNLNAKSAETDVSLTMDLIETLDEPMDAVLLSSVCEACVRIGKPELLVRKLDELQGKDKIVISGSHTCGSLIKAYGHAKDLDGVWRCWKDMRNRHITPTSITVGCMVEAVVNNGDSEGAFELIHQLQQDETCRDSVNAIVYCSTLKGFARERKLDRVWKVYEEMVEKRVEMSLITFNTILDACARAGRMDHVPTILLDMKKHHVEPNIITYSTILKGQCQAGDMQLAFQTLKDMKRETKLKPDEIMYNSLLDGCAQNCLFEEGMQLLEQMQAERIVPSNFTLSITVKLLHRAHKIEQAFDIVKELTQKYKFKPNAHVYTNLIQACIGNRQPNRAFTVLETMVKERVLPDSRTYSMVINSCIYQGDCQQAVSLLRAALGLPGALALPGCSLPACWVDNCVVNQTLNSLADRGCAQSLGAPLIADINKNKIRVNIDQPTLRRITMDSVSGQSPSNGKGKGKGKNAW